MPDTASHRHYSTQTAIAPSEIAVQIGFSSRGVIEAKYQGKSAATKLLIGMCVMVPREVFGAFGLLDESMVLGADDLELSWRLRTAGMKLVIALDTFVHHIGRAGFSQRPPEEVEKLIAESDAALVTKLERYYGPNLPTSQRLWGNLIFEEALRNAIRRA